MPTNTIRILTTDGVQIVDGLDPWERSTVASHWNAVREFLETGDPRTLQRLETELAAKPGGVTVGNVDLGFDLDLIEREAFRGETRFESIYES